MPALYQTNQDVPDNMLLGNLLSYTLVNMTIDENDLLDAFRNNNLPEGYVRKISHADAFRRATSSIKNQKVMFTNDSGETFEGRINVDEVVNDKMYIKRIVGARILNDLDEEVSYVMLGNITYDRANDQYVYQILAYDPNNPGTTAGAQNLFVTAANLYEKWSKYHNHDTIKNTIVRIVRDMYPIALMPTGLNKFIPISEKATLYNLRGLLNDLSQYSDKSNEENIIEIIPILDTDEHRDIVQKRYEDEIIETLYDYSQEVADIIKRKQILTSKQAATYIEKYNDLVSKAKSYQSLLGTYTSNIHQQLKAAIQFVDDNKET